MFQIFLKSYFLLFFDKLFEIGFLWLIIRDRHILDNILSSAIIDTSIKMQFYSISLWLQASSKHFNCCVLVTTARLGDKFSNISLPLSFFLVVTFAAIFSHVRQRRNCGARTLKNGAAAIKAFEAARRFFRIFMETAEALGKACETMARVPRLFCVHSCANWGCRNWASCGSVPTINTAASVFAHARTPSNYLSSAEWAVTPVWGFSSNLHVVLIKLSAELLASRHGQIKVMNWVEILFCRIEYWIAASFIIISNLPIYKFKYLFLGWLNFYEFLQFFHVLVVINDKTNRPY